MRFLFGVSVLLLCFGAPANLALAADWFVSGAGSDANSGTTVGDPFRSITQAASVASPGDTIWVSTGTYDPSNGEVFPILVPDGASILGLGGGNALVSPFGGQSIFEIGDLGSPTTISGLFLDAVGTTSGLGGTTTTTGTGPVFRLTGTPADLRITDNLIRASFGVMDYQHSGSTAAGITIQGNTVLGGIDSFADAVQIDFWGGGQQAVTIRENQVLGSRDAIDLSFEGTGTFDLNVVLNTITGVDSDGIRVYLSAWSSGTGTTVRGKGGRPTLTGNGMIGGNDLYGGFDTAIEHDVSANSGFNVENNIWTRFNRMRWMDQGADFNTWADNDATAIHGPFVGNTILGMLSIGLEHSSNSGTTFSVVVPPDMGGGANGVLMGRNSFFSGTPIALEACGPGTLSARANWWGTTVSSAIDALIYDQMDDPFCAVVEHPFPLGNPLAVNVNRSSVRRSGGQIVKVRAEVGSAFLPRAGADTIRVTLGGQPVRKLTLNDSGKLLGFRTPRLFATGPANLIIENPNGTSVVVPILVTAG